MTNRVHETVGTIPFTSDQRGLGVLVGFDGSRQGSLALHYAARAALRRESVLTVVTAFSSSPDVYTTLAALPEGFEIEAKQKVAEKIQDQAREYLKDYPGEVVYRTERGDAAGVLVDLSSSAQLVVVGARGRGGFLGRILGSVAVALPAHARCPTVVVPRDYQIDGTQGAERFAPVQDQAPVVVGVDGSSQSRIAELQAAQAAQDRGTSLHIVMALPTLEGWLLWYPELGPQDTGVIERRQTELEKSLEAEARWVKSYYPSLSITVTVKAGEAVAVLSKETGAAQLTVVGTRGHGAFTSSVLGSVSRGILLKAEGPVMVVPALEDERLENQPEFTR